jgi:hypothetical protein
MDNVFPIYQLASAKLNSYVKTLFFSKKKTSVDENSILMFNQLMRRLLHYYKDSDSPVIGVEFKIEEVEDGYKVIVLILLHSLEEIVVEDDQLSKSIATLFGAELLKSKEKGEAVKYLWKHIEDFEKKQVEKTEKRKK